MRKVIHISAWGKPYIEKMCDGMLASLVAGEPMCVLRDIDLEITTDHQNIKCKWFNYFKSVSFFPYESVSDDRYVNMGNSDRNFVARSKDKIMFFLPPDCVLASSSLSYAIGKIEEGSKAVVVTGVRCYDKFFPPPLGLSPRDFTIWGWSHIHDFAKLQIWGEVPCWRNAACLWFRAEAGMVGRCFHLHPIAVVNDGRSISFGGTIDLDMLDNYRPEEIFVVDDSDNFSMFEFSGPERNLGTPLKIPMNRDLVGKFATSRNVSPVHEYFFSHRIKFRLGSGSFSAADEVEFPTGVMA